MYPEQKSGIISNDILMTAVSGYIIKLDTRKDNLDIIDNDSWDRPLYGIHYDNFSLPLTVPVDLDSYDLVIEDSLFTLEQDYEMNNFGYMSYLVDNPTLTDATEMVIFFNDTTDTLTIPNQGSFMLSSAHTINGTSDNLIEVTFQIFADSR